MYSEFIRLHTSPVWLTDLDTLRIIEANQAASELFGQGGAGVPGLTMDALCAPEDIPHLQAQLARVRKGEAFNDVCRLKMRVPGMADMAAMWMPVEVEVRQHALIVLQEDCALVAARARLRASDDLLRIAGGLALFGGWRVDPVAGVVHITEQLAAILERPGVATIAVADAIGVLAPEHQDRSRELLRACLEDGTPCDEVMYLITATGKRVCVRAVGEAIRDSDGAIIGAQGALQNVDHLAGERRRAARLADRLHLMLDSMNEGFVALGRTLRVEYLNPLAEKMLGKRRDVAMGLHLTDLLPEPAASQGYAAATRVMDKNLPERMEIFCAQAQRWYRLHLLPSSEGVAIYLQDVTAEMEQAKRLNLLEAAVDGQTDMVEITEVVEGGEQRYRLIYVNAAFERTTGYRADEVIGRSPLVHNGPLTNPAELARIREAIHSGTPLTTEVVNYRKDGSTYLKQADIRPIRDSAGRITNWIATSRDVTVQRATEMALQESEERFRLVARATHDVIWDRHIRLNKSWWSDALFEVFGHDSAAPMVESWEWWIGLVHPQDAERVASSFSAALASRDETWSSAYRMRRGDGTYAHVTDRAYMLRDAEGQVVRVAGCVADVTDQLEMAAKVRRDEKLEAFRQLTGGIAHDFNNLLTVIIGNAELLAESADIAPQHAHLAQAALIAAERGSKLTSELLSFAREQALTPRATDLDLLLKDMEPNLRGALTAGHTLTLRASADLWPTEIDRDQLEASVLAMVRNAVDAMPSGGPLTIETSNQMVAAPGATEEAESGDRAYVQLTIRDSGHGILPEHGDRIFEPFFTTRPTGKGTGLGLSMVYGFVKQCGGFIQVDSAQGRGTAFHLFFPRTNLAVHEGAIGVQRAMPRGFEHVLMVEDDPMVASYVRAQIEDLGYRVTAAANAAEALGLLDKHEDVGLLFTDIMMPGGMNGWQLAETVGLLHPKVKVLLTSGYSDKVFATAPRDGIPILEKPYRRQELASRIRAAFDR